MNFLTSKQLTLAVVLGSLLFSFPTFAKMDMCHAEGNGNFHPITVSINAVSAHLQHGDAFLGRPVPDLEGYRFNDDCVPEMDLCFATVIRAATPTGVPSLMVIVLNDPFMDDWRTDVESWDGGVLQAAIPGSMLPNEFFVIVVSGEDDDTVPETLFFDPSMYIKCTELINLP